LIAQAFEQPAAGLRCIVPLLPGIEVWLARLDLQVEEVAQCANLLSLDERLRADRFYFEPDRRRFIVARGRLRLLLGRRLRIAPAAVAFAYTASGKPFVAGSPERIHFNLAHSAERALYAASSDCHLGVDIEHLNRDIDWRRLSKRLFTRRECAAVRRLSAPHRRRAFFAAWTCKEAIVKALGGGLSLPLNQFEVSIEPDAEPALLSAAGLRIRDWRLYAVDAGGDYVAAIAACRRI
jgi:4'-phosphopantetheinyl transferase